MNIDMQARQNNQLQKLIQFPGLPLAVYREIAAHLCQVEGVQVGLIPQSSQEFDYNQSQVTGLAIEYTINSGWESRERVKQILAYYQERYKS
jgi:hypothetical protein